MSASGLTPEERAARRLDAIEDQARLDVYGHDYEDCGECGGEGVVFDCFDGLCADAEWGCEDCTRRCRACARLQRQYRLRILRELALSLDVDAAILWLRQLDHWPGGIDARHVLMNLHLERVGMTDLSIEDRAASACWVEGLL